MNFYSANSELGVQDMQKIINFTYKIYDLILNNSCCSALFLFFCLLLKVKLPIIIAIAFIMAILSVLSFNKRHSLSSCLVFALCYFVFEFISVILYMKEVIFSSMTWFLHGFFLVAALLYRTLLVFLTYYFANIIFFKIINNEKIKNKIQYFIQFFRQKFFIAVLLSLLALFFALHYSVKYFSTVPVQITAFSDLNFDGYIDEVKLLNDNKICFVDKNSVIIYDLKNKKIYDKYTLPHYKNIHLENTVISVRTENRIFPLSNGNILIQRNYIPKKRNDFNYEPKTYIEVYEPQKGEISALETPYMRDFTSITELQDNKVFFIDRAEEQTFLYDINNNVFNRSANLYIEKYGASVNAISLNDNRIFVLGGYNHPNNYAEIYDFQKGVSEKIPLNFNLFNGLGSSIKLTMMNDERILIQCEKINEKELDGIGKSDTHKTKDGTFLTIYPTPYLTIYNPKDNSFEEIDINRNSKKIIVPYQSAVLKDDNIIIIGGYVDKNSKSRRIKHTKIFVYDTKNHTIKRTFHDLKYEHYGKDILTVLNDGTVLVTGGDKNQIEVLKFKK